MLPPDRGPAERPRHPLGGAPLSRTALLQLDGRPRLLQFLPELLGLLFLDALLHRLGGLVHECLGLFLLGPGWPSLARSVRLVVISSRRLLRRALGLRRLPLRRLGGRRLLRRRRCLGVRRGLRLWLLVGSRLGSLCLGLRRGPRLRHPGGGLLGSLSLWLLGGRWRGGVGGSRGDLPRAHL